MEWGDGMSLSEDFVLPEDVVLQPVAELTETVRLQIGARAGEVAIMREGSRELARVLDADGAELVERFREARTIVGAVIDFSRERGTDPERTLQDSYPLLERLIAARMLAPADSEDARAISATFSAGDRWAGYRVSSCLQVSEDSEVYQAVGPKGETVALKVGRGSRAADHPLLINEALVLEHLRADSAPRLQGAGVEDGRRFVATAWCPGIPLSEAAAELRQRRAADVLALGLRLLERYEELHRAGVLHGDVHPKNVLVSAEGEVAVIDFGIATTRGEGESPSPPRGGMAFFMEPEQARALAAGDPPPQLTAAGEQYALAAMLYVAVTGVHCLDFSLERGEMLRQIANDPPVSLAQRGLKGFGDAERVLFRALEKEPERRFADLAEMREAWAECVESHSADPAPKSRSSSGPEPFAALASAYGVDGEVLAEPPRRCSVHHGSAGIAYALLRGALVRSDARWLALAETWIAKALARADEESSFYDEEVGTEELIGLVSPAHAKPGLHCVRALVAQAAGDRRGAGQAIAAFLESSSAACENLDLTLGRSGTVLASALLLQSGAGSRSERTAIGELGVQTLESIWSQASELPPVDSPDGLGRLGMAHGWAGLLYAALRWQEIASATVELPLDRRLEELAACAEPWGRGLRWRTSVADPAPEYSAGWCNGSAGFVHLWTLAGRADPGGNWGDLARGAAWNAWEGEATNASVCCGKAGCAYALVNFHRTTTNEPEWLDRARTLARQASASRAFENPHGEHSLYQGRLGTALAALEVEADPGSARMPFFESEGWPDANDTPSHQSKE